MRTKRLKPRPRGNLKPALIDAGVALLSEGGLSALKLRSCAARAGVSHAAPAHHFNGLKGLLTAIATRGFETFTAAMIEGRDAANDTPYAQLLGVGDGYLKFARENEAMSVLLFMTDEVFSEDPAYQKAAGASYDVLAQACAPFNSGATGTKGLEVMIWSLVQGYATLLRSGSVDLNEVSFQDIMTLLKLELK